ncbi:MAG: YncE family protein [Thermomicrobiales bacterium]
MHGRLVIALTLVLFTLASLAPAYQTETVRLASPAPPSGRVTCHPVGTPPIVPTESPRSGPSTPVTWGSTVLQTVADIPLPGDASRFDYQSLDETTGRLYIAHMGAGQLVVFDTHMRKVVQTVDKLPTITGVLAVPEAGMVYAAVAGEHQVAEIDDQTLKVMARVGKIGFPDGLAYAPSSKQVFVSDESGGGELVLDTRTNKVVTTIDLGGEAGNTHYDPGSGCIIVAVQTLGQLTFIDPVTDRVIDTVSLDAGCDSPHGFLIDAPARLAFVTCEGNAKLLVVDMKTMQVTATLPVGDGPDVLAFDIGWNRLYVGSESGLVSVFEENGGTLHPFGQITMPNAHSVAVDPDTHLVYFPLADVAGKPVLRIMAPVPPGS